MAGIDDQVSVVGDWAPSNPSPRTFFSTILGDDFGSRSFSEFIGENGSEHLFVGSEKQKVEVSLEEEVGTRDGVSGDFFAESSFFSGQNSSSRGGLAERMAARAGFNAPRLNTARIRSANLSSSPEIRSPYLTIPPGLSPTTLLDSPVFLSNSLAQPSPTTGKFSFAPSSHSKSSMMMSDALDGNKDNPLDDVDSSTFVFKPHVESSSTLFSGAANKVTPSTNSHQSFPSIEVSVQAEQSLQFRSHDHTKIHAQNFNGFHPQSAFQRNPSGTNMTSDSRLSDTIVGNTGHSPPLNDQQEGDGEQRGNGELNSVVGGTPSEDGYNWRKYGQKQVKGSEYPRSYYKCTHPNCQVKKKVERSHEGHITEIIYKGNHNHPKPPPNRRSIMGSANPLSDMQIDIPDQVGARAGMDSDAAWANNNTQGGTIGGGPDWRIDGLEVTSSASMGPPDLCDPSTSLQVQNGPQLESADTVDVLSNLSNDEDEDDRGTHGSVSLGYDEGDESESKRRKIEQMEMSGATRAIREPRVVVQTTSEVDILDDGYRWRKYGQKVVKGNPNPRSYYKCTNAGCTVRKHVERASHDLKSVITTYEGKHNHDVPVARNSTHANSGTSSNAPPPTAQPHVHRPEPSQVHDSMARFERPGSLGSFNLSGRQSMGPTPGFSFGMSQPGLANLAMATLGPTQGRLPMLPVQPYIGQQQRPMNEMGFVMPKGEPKEEPMSDPGMNNLSNGSSVYHQMMSRMPL